MNWFRNLPITGKLIVSFSCLFLLLLGMAAFGLFTIDSTDQDMDDALNARTIRNNTANAELAALRLVYQKSAITSMTGLKDISDGAIETDRLMTGLDQSFTSDRDAQNMLSDLRSKIAGFLDIRKSTGGEQNANELASATNAPRFEDVKSSAIKLANRALIRARERATIAKQIFLVIISAAAILAGILLFMLYKTIAVPMRKLTEAADRINVGETQVDLSELKWNDEVGTLAQSFALTVRSWQDIANAARKVADGDLTVSLVTRSKHDAIINAFNLIISNMALVTYQFREAVNAVSSTANEILHSVNDSAVGANQTATAANTTSAIVEEVRQTSHVANEKAKQVAASAQRTAQITAAGRKATENIIEGMNKIREQVDLIADAMVRLSEKSQSISSIISSVDDMAKQSNLLAVNASVEAARAGELGKGFGVVAQEVKNLAQQSKEANARIRSIIAEMQQATNAAAMATELGGKAVDAALEHSSRAGESISVLAASVVDASHAAAQISASSQQQLAGVDHVAEAMASIRDACDDHLSGIRKVETSVTRLNEISETLQILVMKYNIPEVEEKQESRVELVSAMIS
jgi:methyl-accepting chemotaxis protein